MSTITSSNSVFMLGVDGLYNVPVKMQGYSADDAFSVEEAQFAEKYMGVDGILSAGFTPYIVPLNFVLQADSDSNLIMDAIIAAEKVTREKLVINATIMLPSTSMIYAFTKGYLDSGSLMPAAQKTLRPRKFSIAFQDISSAPV